MLYNQHVCLSLALNLLEIKYDTHTLLEMFISKQCTFPDIPIQVLGTNCHSSSLISCGRQSLLTYLQHIIPKLQAIEGKDTMYPSWHLAFHKQLMFDIVSVTSYLTEGTVNPTRPCP